VAVVIAMIVITTPIVIVKAVVIVIRMMAAAPVPRILKFGAVMIGLTTAFAMMRYIRIQLCACTFQPLAAFM